MTREELVRKLEHIVMTETGIASPIADFILSNFTEKPRPSAKERLADYIGFGCDLNPRQRQNLAHDMLNYRLSELKDILAQHEREQHEQSVKTQWMDETIRTNGRGFGV